jgi:3-oxoacyl-[acyl-carrier protein] reductase
MEHLVTASPHSTDGRRLEGRVAFITGASWGIGAAVATSFARQGASVVVSSYPDEQMERLADDVVRSIADAGGKAIRLSADVTSREHIDEAVAATQREFGDIDVLVANAAYANRLPWHQISAEQWDHTLAANLRGAFLCAQACYEGMLRQGGGSIIAVTSVTVETGMAGMLDYVSSKAGLIGFTRALAREVGEDGIRVNAVMPGAIRTEQEIALGFDEEELKVLLAERQCIPRRGFADDLTGAFLFLASDESSFVSGQVMNVDGGWVHY